METTIFIFPGRHRNEIRLTTHLKISKEKLMGTLTPKHKSDHDIFIGTDKALMIPNLDSYNNITYFRVINLQ